MDLRRLYPGPTVDRWLGKPFRDAWAHIELLYRVIERENADGKEPNQSELARALGRDRGPVSKDLKVLVDCGRVTVRPGERNKKHYRVVE